MFHTIGEINTGNARFHAQFQLDSFSVSRIVYSKPYEKI